MIELVISCVLYRTPPEEVARMIAQVRAVPIATRLILVDNSPEPLSIALPDDGTVEHIVAGANLGYGRGHNIAIEHTKALAARWHLIANTDVRFEADAVVRLRDFLDQHDDVGLAGPHIRFPDGRTQHLCRLLPNPLDLVGRRLLPRTAWGARRARRNELLDWDYSAVADIPFLSGCFMFFRRSVLDALNGFDPRYFLYAEDLDLSRRAHAISRTVYVPAAEIVHDYRSLGGRNWRMTAYLIDSHVRYFAKWGMFRDPEARRINAETRRRLGLSGR